MRRLVLGDGIARISEFLTLISLESWDQPGFWKPFPRRALHGKRIRLYAEIIEEKGRGKK